MKRVWFCGLTLLTLAACQGGPDQRPAPLAPLPEKVQPLPYGRLLERARSQARAANEAFYVDNWNDLEESARGLEQIAQYLVVAEDKPPKHRDTMVTMSADLGKYARSLREAAAAKDVKKTTELLTRIQMVVREMRLGDGS
ncbi:MAG: hypothetical protein U0840_03175 [Gemmataceae bacterium]